MGFYNLAVISFVRYFLCCLTFLLVQNAAASEDYILSRAVFTDPSGELTFEQVRTAQFSPARPVLTAGFSSAVHWLRLEVRVRADGGALMLRIRPTHLGTLTLFEPDGADGALSGQWRTRVTGEHIPWVEREHASVQHGFSIQPSQTTTTYYLRLQTTRSAILQVQALTPFAAEHANLVLGLWQGLYLAVLASILVWTLHDFGQTREAVMGWFALMQTTNVVYSLALMGLLAPLFAQSNQLAELTSLAVCAIVLTSLLFHRHFLGLFQPPRPLLWTLNALIVIGLIALGLLISGQAMQGLHLNSVVALLAAPVLLASAWAARHNALPGLRAVRWFYSVQAASLVVGFVPLLGLIEGAEWSLHGMLVQGLMVSLLMVTLLYKRSTNLRRQARLEHTQLQLAQQELSLKLEQLTETRHFVDMLTHEIKTPLSIIRLSSAPANAAHPGSQRIHTAIRDIDVIVERCRQTGLLDQGAVQSYVRACKLTDVLAESAAATSAPERIQLAPTATADAGGADSDRVLQTDPHLLGVILSNLLDNALKYSPAGSMVTAEIAVVSHDDQPGLRVRVSNLIGPAGLPDPLLVFNKYYRSPRALSKSGSGLGLFLVQAIAAKLGGHVVYACIDGQVTFSVWLPQ